MDLLHTCLNVANVERSLAFYTEELDFAESWSFETEDGRTLNQYVAADNGVELQLSATEGQSDFERGTAWDHLAVGVENVNRAFEAIDHYGVVQEPADQPAAGARTAFVEDPDGHVVELIEPLEG
jgi:lactoylglutathione lyase